MKIRIKNLQNKIQINPQQITKISKAILAYEKIKPTCELSLLFVRDKFIKALNKKYFNSNRPTDVIAFPIDTKPESDLKSYLIGEVVISAETVHRNAPVYEHKPAEELIFCLIHGILHLVGYIDKTKRSKGKMFKKQTRILRKLKLDGIY